MKIEAEKSTEYQDFKALLGRVLSVSREEMQRREAEYQKRVTLNPNRRGPKPKLKPDSDSERRMLPHLPDTTDQKP